MPHQSLADFEQAMQSPRLHDVVLLVDSVEWEVRARVVQPSLPPDVKAFPSAILPDELSVPVVFCSERVGITQGLSVPSENGSERVRVPQDCVSPCIRSREGSEAYQDEQREYAKSRA